MKDLACPLCRLFGIDRIMTCQPGQQDIPVITDPFMPLAGFASRSSRISDFDQFGFNCTPANFRFYYNLSSAQYRLKLMFRRSKKEQTNWRLSRKTRYLCFLFGFLFRVAALFFYPGRRPGFVPAFLQRELQRYALLLSADDPFLIPFLHFHSPILILQYPWSSLFC